MKHAAKFLITSSIIAVLSVCAAAFTSTSEVIDPPMKDFFSLDRQHLWALIQNSGNREFLFSSTDGGATWSASAVPYSIWRVFFADAGQMDSEPSRYITFRVTSFSQPDGSVEF